VGLSVKTETLGWKTRYEPACAIGHWVPQNRLSEKYLGERAFFVGLHRSFTEYRREHGLGPGQGVPPVQSPGLMGRLRRWARRFLMVISPERKKISPAEDVARLQAFFLQRMKAGWDFHRQALETDPDLPAYVLRPDFMDGNASLPGLAS
jgi:hypothetical protein